MDNWQPLTCGVYFYGELKRSNEECCIVFYLFKINNLLHGAHRQVAIITMLHRSKQQVKMKNEMKKEEEKEKEKEENQINNIATAK